MSLLKLGSLTFTQTLEGYFHPLKFKTIPLTKDLPIFLPTFGFTKPNVISYPNEFAQIKGDLIFYSNLKKVIFSLSNSQLHHQKRITQLFCLYSGSPNGMVISYPNLHFKNEVNKCMCWKSVCAGNLYNKTHHFLIFW